MNNKKRTKKHIEFEKSIINMISKELGISYNMFIYSLKNTQYRNCVDDIIPLEVKVYKILDKAGWMS